MSCIFNFLFLFFCIQQLETTNNYTTHIKTSWKAGEKRYRLKSRTDLRRPGGARGQVENVMRKMRKKLHSRRCMNIRYVLHTRPDQTYLVPRIWVQVCVCVCTCVFFQHSRASTQEWGWNYNQHQNKQGKNSTFLFIPSVQTVGPSLPRSLAPDKEGGSGDAQACRSPRLAGPALPFQVHLISAAAANLSWRQVLSCHSL